VGSRLAGRGTFDPVVALDLRFSRGASAGMRPRRGAYNLNDRLLEKAVDMVPAILPARRPKGIASSFRFSVDDEHMAISTRFLTEISTPLSRCETGAVQSLVLIRRGLNVCASKFCLASVQVARHPKRYATSRR